MNLRILLALLKVKHVLHDAKKTRTLIAFACRTEREMIFKSRSMRREFQLCTSQEGKSFPLAQKLYRGNLEILIPFFFHSN